MTTADKTTQHTPRAADSGASATDHFLADRATDGAADIPQERIDALARAVLDGIHDTVRRYEVTYDEFNALKAWMIRVGEDGEWPLFLDVWIEHVVEDVNTAHRSGSKGSIEGPYYVPGAPDVSDGNGVGTVPMRDGEQGTPLVWKGTITSTDQTPLEDATIEIWHADDAGYYSQFEPDQPEWNLRATLSAGPGGAFEIHTIQPAPYQIPTDGACGALIAAAGWHAWRPAHIHVKVSAPGHELLTAQLYFPGDAHNDDDIANAVKPELMLDPQPQPDGSATLTYDFVLDPVRS